MRIGCVAVNREKNPFLSAFALIKGEKANRKTLIGGLSWQKSLNLTVIPLYVGLTTPPPVLANPPVNSFKLNTDRVMAQTTPGGPENTQETTQPPGEEARVLVAEVVVEGVEGELQDLVYNTIQTRPGRPTTRSRLQEDVNAIFATGFFRNVKVTPEDTPLGVRITYQVQPNPVLSRVEIKTLPEKPQPRAPLLPSEVVQRAFREQYGKIINFKELQNAITELNKWYTDNGYDLAQVIGAPQVQEDGVVTLMVAEGEIAQIKVRFFNADQEEVKGKTRDFIVTREMRLKPGDIFNRRTAQEDLQRIYGLGIFKDVRISFDVAPDPSQVIMNVDIVETGTGSLAAGAGISSVSGFFGTISYQERNLGGNNQTLGAEFQVGERELLFDLSFENPWIAGDPYRTSLTANLFRRRTISLVFDGTETESIRTELQEDRPRVVRTGGGFSISRPLSDDPLSRPEWVLSAGLQYQQVEIQDADGNRAPRSSPKFGRGKLAFNDNGIDELLTFRFTASQDRRNDALNPTSGSLLLLGMEQTLPVTNVVFNRLRASYSYYIPVKFVDFTNGEGPQALAFNIQGGTVLGDLPPYEAFVIGGSNSVRGYGEGDLGNGRSYLQATAEYRFPILPFLGGVLFFDYATTLGSQKAVIGQPAKVRGLKGDGFGYGLGVRVQSPLGPIRIDYGVNDRGDSRIHFGVGERF